MTPTALTVSGTHAPEESHGALDRAEAAARTEEHDAPPVSDRRTNRRGALRTLVRVAAAATGAGALVKTQSGSALAATIGDWTLRGNAHTTASNFLGTTDSQPLVLKTASTEALRITTSGAVGIGTPTPIFKLQVAAPNQLGLAVNGPASGVGAGLQLQTVGSGAQGWELLSTGAASTQGAGKLNIRDLATAADIVTISAENVGIGITSPTAKLHVVSSGSAGFFGGDVQVTGTLSKGGVSFKIDHPLDPANKYLSHSFVESPDMLNIYNGTAVLDAHGRAVVELPAWFEALNAELRYQLTAVGAPGPNLHIAQEVHGGRFTIAGGAAGLKVCWQVTGVRQDAWANAYRIVVEDDKSAEERGYYLHPELYGAPRDRAIRRP